MQNLEQSDLPLNIDNITTRVIDSFSPLTRANYARDEVKSVVASLHLAKHRRNRQVPRLLIRRLKFTGTKSLDGVESPINYDQRFSTGVNALVIEDNLVGKSSILKTIKFALTGSDDEYDQEVRRWITQIWLQVSLDQRAYTILLARREDGLHGRLVPGDHECSIDGVPKDAASRGFWHRGQDEVQQALESFFVNEFGLASLGWNQKLAKGDGASVDAWASWRTYFQALRIPDDNHTYLLSKQANQDQLLFSAFLGLHLSEPLNRLSMQSAAIRKRKIFSQEEQQRLASMQEGLVKQREVLKRKLATLDSEQDRRVEVLVGGEPAVQLTEARGKFIEAKAEVGQIEEQVKMLTLQVKKLTATARRVREKIDIGRELSGLEVKICPNCTRGIESSALLREKESHQCRLCVRPILISGEDEADATRLEATAQDYDRQVIELRSRIAKTKRDLAVARGSTESYQSLIETLRTTIKEGVSKGLPTAEEKMLRGELHEGVGEIGQKIAGIKRQIGDGENSEDHERKDKIIKKVTALLKEEAKRRNHEIEARLNELATEVIRALRADQISGVKCYPTGVVKLTKNGEPVSFSKIHNPGERYRVKLALFLAMMRLRCDPGVGHHPGLLLLDQLGSAEMVPEDLQALAAALRQIEDKFSDEVQIICFTAKPEFRDATVAAKVYGRQTDGKQGKEYAF